MNKAFEKLHHICLVVHDLDRTQAHYESIGIAPWIVLPPMTDFDKVNVPNPAAFAKLRYRICNLPNIQLQLCQPGDERSPQRDHLDSKGEGVFHIGFEVPDADAAEADSGIPVMMSGRRANGTGFTYYDTADAGVVLVTRSSVPTG